MFSYIELKPTELAGCFGCRSSADRPGQLQRSEVRTRMASNCLALVVVALLPSWLWASAPTDGSFEASDGVRIHYLEAGKQGATGAPVVLIHGYTGSAQGNWFANGVADALAKRHWVVAIDCRGHGQSEKPHDPEKYGPQMARDVLELMDHLKIDRAHVHGYSMGG